MVRKYGASKRAKATPQILVPKAQPIHSELDRFKDVKPSDAQSVSPVIRAPPAHRHVVILRGEGHRIESDEAESVPQKPIRVPARAPVQKPMPVHDAPKQNQNQSIKPRKSHRRFLYGGGIRNLFYSIDDFLTAHMSKICGGLIGLAAVLFGLNVYTAWFRQPSPPNSQSQSSGPNLSATDPGQAQLAADTAAQRTIQSVFAQLSGDNLSRAQRLMADGRFGAAHRRLFGSVLDLIHERDAQEKTALVMRAVERFESILRNRVSESFLMKPVLGMNFNDFMDHLTYVMSVTRTLNLSQPGARALCVKYFEWGINGSAWLNRWVNVLNSDRELIRFLGSEDPQDMAEAAHAVQVLGISGAEPTSREVRISINFAFAIRVLGLEHAKELYRRNGIRWFMRYTPATLQNAYATLSTTPTDRHPLLFAAIADSDWNGAMTDIGHALDFFNRTYRVDLGEYTRDSDLFVRIVQSSQRYGKIQTVFLSGHGSPDDIQLSDDLSRGNRDQGLIDQGDAAQMDALIGHGNLFVDRAYLLLASCATGNFRNGPPIANTIARTWGLTVLAPMLPASLRTFYWNEEGILSNVGFNDSPTITIFR